MTTRIPAITLNIYCDKSWCDMDGDEAVRYCQHCHQLVYNLSSMTARQVKQLLDNEKNPCVRFFLRSDGTILTRDCTVDGRHWLSDWSGQVRKTAIVASLFVLLAACSKEELPQEKQINQASTQVKPLKKPIVHFQPVNDSNAVMMGGA